MALVSLVTIFIHASRKTFFYSTVTVLAFWFSIDMFGDVNLPRRMEQSKRLVSFDDTGAWSGRNIIWEAGFEMVKESPIIGQGYGISTEIMPDYLQEAGASRILRIRMHNTYLKVWAELGIIGLFFFVAILYFSMRSYYATSNWFTKKGDMVLYILLFGEFANVLGNSAIAMFGWSGYLDKSFWLFIAIALATGKIVALNQKQSMIKPR